MPRKNKYSGNDGGPTPGEVDPPPGNENPDRKYGRRQIRSNWDRYGTENLGGESVDEKKTNDFADLINSPSDCNYFQFKSEKNWEREAASSTFSGHKFFNLDLEVLSHGLACLPFYERVEIDKSLLSESDIERCDRKANEALTKYKKVREKFIKKLEEDYEQSGLVEDVSGITSKPKMDIPQVIHADIPDESSRMETVTESFGKATNLVEEGSDCKENVKGNKSEKESLEEWLDSVLDD